MLPPIRAGCREYLMETRRGRRVSRTQSAPQGHSTYETSALAARTRIPLPTKKPRCGGGAGCLAGQRIPARNRFISIAGPLSFMIRRLFVVIRNFRGWFLGFLRGLSFCGSRLASFFVGFGRGEFTLVQFAVLVPVISG